jgi:hypothetical protein
MTILTRFVFLQVALATLLASSAAAEANKAPGKQSQEPGWKDCVVSERTPTVRIVKCPDAELRFMRSPTMHGEQGIRTFLAGAGLSAPVETLQIGNKQMSYAVSPNPSSRMLVASPQREFLVVCYAKRALAAEPCLPRVSWMVTHGLPPEVAFPEPNMRFADVTLRVPEGCTMQGAERIVCQTGSLDFREEKARPNILDALQGLYAAAGVQVKAAQQQPCSLGKYRGEGRVLDVSASTLSFTVMLCAAQSGGRSFTAMCIGADPRKQSSYPVPCNQVLR